MTRVLFTTAVVRAVCPVVTSQWGRDDRHDVTWLTLAAVEKQNESNARTIGIVPMTDDA